MNSRASQNKPELWIEEDRRLFFAETITIKATGECFNIEDKLEKIHTYMLDQYNSYRADGKNFYEDQRDIATKCKCTPKTLGKWLKVLQALGLLIIDESQKSHAYTVRSVVSQQHNLIFDYPKLLNGKPSYDHEEALKRLYASQGRRNVKNHQPKTEESGKNEQKPVVDIPVDADLSGSDDPSLSDSTGRNVVELPRNGRPKLSFKFVSPDDDDLENYSKAPQVDFDKDGQPPNKWKDFDMATTCDLLYDL